MPNNHFYTYQEHYPNCYSLHRPDGTDFMFLQGDDARAFEASIELIEGYRKIEGLYPCGVFENADHNLLAVIDQYDM